MLYNIYNYIRVFTGYYDPYYSVKNTTQFYKITLVGSPKDYIAFSQDTLNNNHIDLLTVIAPHDIVNSIIDSWNDKFFIKKNSELNISYYIKGVNIEEVNNKL